MPPTKAERTTKNADAAEANDISAAAGRIETSYIDELIKNLHSRLGGGAQNEFFEAGSRLDGKQNKAQLETTFALPKVLQEYNDQYKQQPVEPEQPKASGKAANPTVNKNKIATIEKIVEQKMSEKLRDASIHTERLVDAQKKLENENEALKRDIKALKAKGKEDTGSEVEKLEAEIETLQMQIRGVKAKVKQNGEDIVDLNIVFAMEDDVRAVTDWMNDITGGSHSIPRPSGVQRRIVLYH